MNPGTPRILVASLALILAAAAVHATSFVVPSDEELVEKAHMIVIGTIEGSYTQQNEWMIETVYELRVERSIRNGPAAGELLRITSPGGVIGDQAVKVHGAAHFAQGDRVLLFLSRHRERWETTDLALGKFTFVTGPRGAKLLLRDTEEIVGWDRAGNVHRERGRSADAFLRFVEARAAGRQATNNYFVDSAETTPAKSLSLSANATSYPPASYTDWVSGQPTRWPNISAGVSFHKRSTTNIAGAADGGVSVIQSGLAAWTNECGSVINLIYAGQVATASANFDTTHVVEFNDPQGRVAGSWTGSGTIAITFTSYSGTHSFAGRTWWNISDADAVFQDGFPATHSAFAPAMTHELGHAIGWRHSNQHFDGAGACDPSVEECTSAAIMNSTVSGNYGFTLQPYDVNAAQSVYPGGTCGPACTPPSITAQPQSTTITTGGSMTLNVTATGTAPLSYQWYIGASGNTSSPISGATGSSLPVSPGATTSYWVRVSNACGSANSATATVTVTSAPAPGVRRRFGDYNGDGRSDPALFRPATGQWLISGVMAVTFGTFGDQPAPADYDGNGTTDIAVFRPSNGTWYFRLPISGMVLGRAGDIAVPGDYDGDGRAEAAVLRPSTAQWIIQDVGTITFGAYGDQPVPADYDGNGTTDVAVFRPSNGTWYFHLNMPGVVLGQPGDIGVPGDYNGDGRADPAVFRPSTALWQVHNVTTVTFGNSGDRPAPGDYDGNGTTDMAVFRPSTGAWSFRASIGPIQWGQQGDIALFVTPLGRSVRGDYNGDRRTDAAVFRPSTGQWFVNGVTSVPFGANGDQPVPADYDGSGTTDIAVFRPSNGTWYFNLSMPGIVLGGPGDIAVPGDYDGDGRAEAAVFRPSTGQWFIQDVGTIAFGANGDQPVPADYDGNGTTDVAVFRPSIGTWYFRANIPGVVLGQPGDVPVPGDYNGDGRAEPAVFRSGLWLIQGAATVSWGQSGDRPVPGDYDGDGTTDVAIFRPSTSTWHFSRPNSTLQFGAPGDIPLSK